MNRFGDAVLQLFSLLQQDRQKSPRSRRCTIASTFADLRAELDELEAAFAEQDPAHFKEELGDVVWVALFLLVLARESGGCEPDEVIEGAIAKLAKRKPWLLSGQAPTAEEEAALWEQAKRAP